MYIIALVYFIDTPRISYLFLPYNWYLPRICFQKVHLSSVSQVHVVYVRKEQGYVQYVPCLLDLRMAYACH